MRTWPITVPGALGDADGLPRWAKLVREQHATICSCFLAKESRSNPKASRQGDGETDQAPQVEPSCCRLSSAAAPVIGWIHGAWSQWHYIRPTLGMGPVFVKMSSPTAPIRIPQIGGIQQRPVAFGCVAAGNDPAAAQHNVFDVWLITGEESLMIDHAI